MSERVSCKNPECSGTILPQIAEKTGGYCRPCVNAIKAQEFEEYVKKNRRDVNVYEGMTDLTEILITMSQRRPYDPLINYVAYPKSREEVYAALTPQDMVKLKQHIIDLLDEDDFDSAEDFLLAMALLTEDPLEECLAVLVEKNYYRPELAFRQASASIRNHLLEQLEEDKGNRSSILLALVWQGDKQVVEKFNELRNHPPQWQKELYVPPYEYSLQAGWELTASGEKRPLFYKDCYPLLPGEEGQNSAVQVIQQEQEHCPWCGSQLVTLFNFDLTQPEFEFLGVSGTRLKIVTCHFCTCYGPIFMEVDNNGQSSWSAFNIRPDYYSDPEPVECLENIHQLVLAKEKRSWHYAASPFMEADLSQIGGHPTWLQDAEYPVCPKCSQKMHFIGQVDGGSTMAYGEGIYYAFYCKDCQMSAVYYQQT